MQNITSTGMETLMEFAENLTTSMIIIQGHHTKRPSGLGVGCALEFRIL
jgi:hypothetical protein